MKRRNEVELKAMANKGKAMLDNTQSGNPNITQKTTKVGHRLQSLLMVFGAIKMSSLHFFSLQKFVVFFIMYRLLEIWLKD